MSCLPFGQSWPWISGKQQTAYDRYLPISCKEGQKYIPEEKVLELFNRASCTLLYCLIVGSLEAHGLR
jgi:hypothetical protein